MFRFVTTDDTTRLTQDVAPGCDPLAETLVDPDDVFAVLFDEPGEPETLVEGVELDVGAEMASLEHIA